MSEVEVTRCWLGDKELGVNIGTMVIRAYSWHAIVPGIIVEEIVEEVITHDELESYTQIEFIVQWSDGTQTKELYDELDAFLGNPYIQNQFNMRRKEKENGRY